MTRAWIDRFRLRHETGMKTVSGKSGSAPVEVTSVWQRNELSILLQECSAENIFNADESGLFYKCLPNRTLAKKKEKSALDKKFQRTASQF
ncbi:tigger transposable element-derived protein 4-like [Plakobranchus ocellatus]|uniref:Tigger transposable element-derived protein 4-like n=1 Tax=Plakobranchus ocellatus TaxID=259542 RepID=A0AAV4C8Z9_9GAST|nr:tigger transposable element-derived protein 4-like [Plakobranchus ocellatus]